MPVVPPFVIIRVLNAKCRSGYPTHLYLAIERVVSAVISGGIFFQPPQDWSIRCDTYRILYNCAFLQRSCKFLSPEYVTLRCPAAQDLKLERQKHADQLAAQVAASEAALAPARRLAATLIFKGYKLTLPQVHVGNKRPYVDAEGSIHWPVLLMYPETGQQDVIEDWHEDDTVADHLDVVGYWAGSGYIFELEPWWHKAHHDTA